MDSGNGRNYLMTSRQLETVKALQSEGFEVGDQAKSICMRRGNDCRLVMADGSQKRAKGARR